MIRQNPKETTVTIDTASTAQKVLAANYNRTKLRIINESSNVNPVYVKFGDTATADSSSIIIMPGGVYESIEDQCSLDYVSVLSAKAGHNFTIEEYAIVGPQIIGQSGIPMIIPPSGTVNANGGLVLGTALAGIFTDCFMYFPANAISAGSTAGIYFVQMSSTTVGTIFSNRYTGGVPSIPSSPTAIVAAARGAYAQTTGVNITILYLTIPANVIDKNGSLEVYPLFSLPANANNKATLIQLGTSIGAAFGYASIASDARPIIMTNRGVANKNVWNGWGGLQSNASSAVNRTAIDTTISQTLLIISQLAVATDYIVMESFTVTIKPQP